MSFASWLRTLKARFQPSAGRRLQPARRLARTQLGLEVLEDRVTPATLTVNSLADTVSGTTATLDLREAIQLVNSGGTATDSSNNSLSAAKATQVTGTFGINDAIQFDPGLNGQTITLTGGELLLSHAVTISGPGASQLAVSGNNASRVFEVARGVTAFLSDLTVENGFASGTSGGGIDNGGTLTVSGCTLSHNAADGYGGGITNEGTLTASGSTFTANSAFNGGGIDNGGALAVTGSTFSANSASHFGGGIFNEGSTLTASGSTFSANSAFEGGGIFNEGGTLTASGSTFSANSAFYAGGGLYFYSGSPEPAVLTNVTITANLCNTAGSEPGSENGGGGVYNGSTLTVNNSTLSGNSGPNGGGVCNLGTLTVNDSTLSGNSASNGGGILNFATLTVRGSTLSGNSVTVYGGAIDCVDASSDLITNSTIAGNSANDSGGGIAYQGTQGPGCELTDVTIADNRCNSAGFGGQGGGIYVDTTQPRLYNTIVAGNLNGPSPSATADDVAGELYSTSSNNLFGTGGSGGLLDGVYGNRVVVINPSLAPLGNYGGPTQTIALLPGSPAIDAGSNALAGDPSNGNPLTTDQRGFSRIYNGTVDIGAFEVQPLPSTTAVISSANPSVYGQAVTFTATVSDGAPGLPAPTGSVDFVDTTSGTDLGTATLTVVNGQDVATLTISSLAIGNHTITAQYGGDSNFLASTSPVLTQTINAATVTWINPNGGDWDTASNWSTGAVPDAHDAVVIDLGQNGITVTHSSSAADAVYSLSSQDAIGISNGSLSVATASTINGALTLSNGTLGGAGDLTVNGPFTWMDGTLSGSGVLTANGPVTAANDNLLGFSFINNSSFTLTNYIIDISDGSRFDNYGTFAATNTAYLVRDFDGDTPGFHNYGTVTWASTVPGTGFQIAFFNSGSVAVHSGTLTFSHGGSSTGPFTGDAGTTLDFSAPFDFQTGTTITADSVAFGGGPMDVSIPYSAVASTTVSGANVTFSGPVSSVGALSVLNRGLADFSPATGGPVTLTLPSLTITGPEVSSNFSTLAGSDSFTVNGPFVWINSQVGESTLSGSGVLTANGPVTAANDNLLGFSFINNSSFTQSAGLDIGYGNLFDNRGSFTLLGGALVRDFFGDTRGFSNEGSVSCSAGSGGSATFQIAFSNSGTVEAQSGTLNFALSYIQSAGSTILDGGNISGALNIQGGVLKGTGTISGSVSNGGQVSPGLLSPGLITLQGDYTQTGTGDLAAQIAGPGAGTQYAQLVVLGAVNLDGTLHLQLVGGFVPVLNGQFVLIDNQGSQAVNGIFAGLPEGAVFQTQDGTWQITYQGGDGNDVVLTRLQAPTSTGLLVSASTPLAGVDPVTLTATVTATTSGNVAPSGTVDFYDSTTGIDLGSAPLVNGVASLTAGTFAVGTHTITATYSGDANFVTSSATRSLRAVAPSSLSGTVFADFNDDGLIDFGEGGIAGVSVHLTGTDDLGNAVDRTLQTDSDGAYLFLDLRPGSYDLTKTTQPSGYTPGIDRVGTAGGSLSTTVADQFFVQLPEGTDGLNYNYGEQPAATGGVQKGQTAGIGFWQNKNGQALILAFNGGGASHELGDWLAATLPNIFGSNSANDLAGKNNAYVAALFRQDFLKKGVKLDAQLLATALSVYATNATLDSTQAAASYGFTVNGSGLGTATFSVGDNGAAFGVADNTTMTVLDLLQAADSQAKDGVLYGGDKTLRAEANNVFGALNEVGDGS